ncbi:hypothetical protein ACIREK_29160 [Streptomyces sp. NPDC102415]|uniref:hypothetical protein n=1 Tax=Streptomyces sp. NPDC102415 TaxID=3366173 RepID=UPI003827883C
MTYRHGIPAADTGHAEPAPAPQAFSFHVQPEFHTVPLGLGENEEAFHDQLREFTRDYWGERQDLEALRRLTSAMYAANAQTLAEGGTVYNACGVFPIGGSADGAQSPERHTRATLTVSVRELANADPHLTAAGIAESLDKAAGSGGGAESQPVTLPAGPAVVRIVGSRAVWDLPDGEQECFFVRIEVWLPFPDEDRLLLLCLSTADVQDLHFYQAILADIADTVVFGTGKQPEVDDTTMHSAPSPFSAY